MYAYFVQYQNGDMSERELMIVTGTSFDDVRDVLPATTIAVYESELPVDDERLPTIERGVKSFLAANRIL